MKTVTEKENGVFSFRAEGIKTKGEAKEAIHQLQLIEEQMSDNPSLSSGLIITSEGDVNAKGIFVGSYIPQHFKGSVTFNQLKDIDG